MSRDPFPRCEMAAPLQILRTQVDELYATYHAECHRRAAPDRCKQPQQLPTDLQALITLLPPDIEFQLTWSPRRDYRCIDIRPRKYIHGLEPESYKALRSFDQALLLVYRYYLRHRRHLDPNGGPGTGVDYTESSETTPQ